MPLEEPKRYWPALLSLAEHPQLPVQLSLKVIEPIPADPSVATHDFSQGDTVAIKHSFVPWDNPRLLQKNSTATNVWQERTIEWRYNDAISPEDLDVLGQGPLSGDGNFVRSLEVGDCVTLWKHARFPGWRCNLEEATIEIYWMV